MSRRFASLSTLLALLHPHLTGADCPPTAPLLPLQAPYQVAGASPDVRT